MRLSGGGQREDREQPPIWLLFIGYAGLLVQIGGYGDGGRWGTTLAQAGAILVCGCGLVFVTRLLAWWTGRE